ncbi:MAG: hypothetical protein JWM63_4977 [Gammaproteobacteria bacterium]|jgi:hypothetical protein|nr:hypothetical protein [Gammaproteobacteria bacterium]
MSRCQHRTFGTFCRSFAVVAPRQARAQRAAERCEVATHPSQEMGDHLSDIEVRWRTSHPDPLATCETSERNLFHRSPAQAVRKPRVVNDLATADVDSVTPMVAAGRDEVRTQRRFLVTHQEIVGSVQSAERRTLML